MNNKQRPTWYFHCVSRISMALRLGIPLWENFIVIYEICTFFFFLEIDINLSRMQKKAIFFTFFIAFVFLEEPLDVSLHTTLAVTAGV